MTSPLVFALILEADGGIECFTLYIVLIDKQSEAQTHTIGSILGCQQQLSSNALTAISIILVALVGDNVFEFANQAAMYVRSQIIVRITLFLWKCSGKSLSSLQPS